MTELECFTILEDAIAKARAAIEKEKEAGSKKKNRKEGVK